MSLLEEAIKRTNQNSRFNARTYSSEHEELVIAFIFGVINGSALVEGLGTKDKAGAGNAYTYTGLILRRMAREGRLILKSKNPGEANELGEK